MLKKESGWKFRIVTGVLVALVSLISFAEFLPHTDDGCAVESHCLACRAHMSAITDLTTPVVFVIGIEEIGRRIVVVDQVALEASHRLLPQGRAPPASA